MERGGAEGLLAWVTNRVFDRAVRVAVEMGGVAKTPWLFSALLGASNRGWHPNGSEVFALGQALGPGRHEMP